MSSITHLQFLESEAIYILRETAAQFEKPALLFSGGKDSTVVLDLARRVDELAYFEANTQSVYRQTPPRV